MVAWGHALLQGGGCIGHDVIGSMSGRYASYLNAFLFDNCAQSNMNKANRSWITKTLSHTGFKWFAFSISLGHLEKKSSLIDYYKALIV